MFFLIVQPFQASLPAGCAQPSRLAWWNSILQGLHGQPQQPVHQSWGCFQESYPSWFVHSYWAFLLFTRMMMWVGVMIESLVGWPWQQRSSAIQAMLFKVCMMVQVLWNKQVPLWFVCRKKKENTHIQRCLIADRGTLWKIMCCHMSNYFER